MNVINNQEERQGIIDFQKDLNRQFLEIYEKREGGEIDDVGVHALIDEYSDILFLIQLKNLDLIGDTDKVESLPLMNDFIAGFNQVQGDVYTVFDINRVVNLLINSKEDKQKLFKKIDASIGYIRDKSAGCVSFFVNSLDIQMLSDYSKILHCDYNSADFGRLEWSVLPDVEINSESLKEKEQWLLNEVLDLAKTNTVQENALSIIESNVSELNNLSKEDLYKNLAFILVEDVYWDKNKKRPVFAIDFHRLAKSLLMLDLLK